MGIAHTIQLTMKAAVHRAVGRLADPRESLDYSYQRQAELLAHLRRSGAGAATARLEITVEASRVRMETIAAASDAAAARRRLGDVCSRLAAGTAASGRLLTELRSGLADLAACRGRLDQEIGTLGRLRAEVAGQARQALEDGREDLAREAAVRRAGIDRQRSDLVAQRDSWQADLERFTAVYEQHAGH
jgi:phage shock protein A